MKELMCGSYIEMTMQDLIDRIKETYGDGADMSKISISIEHKQFQCFGYDQYDSSDYRIEMESHYSEV